MCIAIGKLKGIDVPSEDILRTCFVNNDDGAGFAFAYGGNVYIKKGYMTFDDFYNAFSSYDKKYNFKNLGVLIHFRIATHGARDSSMTHPFPISSDDGALKKIEYVSDYAVVHNGIISLTSTTASRQQGLSDTAVFIRDYLSDIAKNDNWFNKNSNFELIHRLIESKMAVLNKDGDISFTSGFTEDNGIYYSNSSYKENRIKTSSVISSSNSTYASAYNTTPYSIYNSTSYNSTSESRSGALSDYVALCNLCDNYDIDDVELDDGTTICMTRDDFSDFFIDANGNLYEGCIDASVDYDDENLPYYWWIYEKIGHVKTYYCNAIEVDVTFIGDTFAYAEQFF